MFVKVSFDELVNTPMLEYGLYNLAGELLYEAGTVFSNTQLSELRAKTVYRDTDALPQMDFIDHEGTIYRFPEGLSFEDRQELQAEQASESAMGSELTGTFISSVSYFLAQLQRGASPDIALCEVVRDKLISEVTSQVEQIRYLSQIRVRDEYTYSHILDVTALSIALAMKAGFSKKEVKEIALAAILHDLGKLMIPRDIMFKAGRLSEKEFQVMQLHPELGYKTIIDVLYLPERIARPAREHQEMYGGGGYPLGLKGDEIHPYSHLVKIADVYDALTSKRPYKESIPSSKAIRIMLSEGEKSFHPEFLAKFVELSNYRDYREEGVPQWQEIAS